MVRRLLPWLLLALPAVAAPVAPDRRGAVVPDRSFDAEKLLLDLTILPEERAVEGHATWTVRRLAPGPLVLDQVELSIRGVEVDGKAAPFQTIGDTLVVEGIGERATVAVSYRATPANGLHWRAPGPQSPDTYAEVWSQGEGEDNRYWFPGYDHPNDRFVYEGRFTAPDGWKVLTNAAGTDLVTYLVMVAAGPYEVHGAGAIEVWVPPGTPEAAWRPALDPIAAMMAHFEARTGVAYPWAGYRQVFVQRFLYSGMENTGATVEHARLLVEPPLAATRPRNRAIFAHELAHQWFGDLLTCRDWRELWLNEGFATFLEGDYTGTAEGADAAARIVRGWYLASQNPESLAGRYFQDPATPNRNVYNKGASVLTMLRVLLGEDRFWAGMRAYTRDHQHGLVHSRDLQVAMEDASGQSLDWFFQQWVELPHVPRLDASWRHSEGEAIVTLSQAVSESVPAYTLPVDLEIGQAGQAPLRRRVWLEEGRLEVHVPAPLAPTYVAVDPTGGLLVDLHEDQAPAAWRAQLASPSPYARLLAIEALGRAEDPAPLAALLADASAPLAIRLAAAAALGEQRSAGPLVAALGDREPRIRLGAATALKDAALPEQADALAHQLGLESSPDIRAALLTALAAADPARALPVARAWLRRAEDDGENGAATAVVGDRGAVSDLPALLVAPAPRDRRLGGLRAATRIAARAPEGAAREDALARVARSAEALLDDLDLRGRQGAVAVLGDVGDKRSITRLEVFRRSEDVRALQVAAGAAVTAIRARTAGAPPPANEMDARVRALEDRLEQLEEESRRWSERH